MLGKRTYPNGNGDLWLEEGEYGRDPRNGVWYARPPGFRVGSLQKHEVLEHEDGSITVFPSIFISYTQGDTVCSWHGYLERGIWRAV